MRRETFNLRFWPAYPKKQGKADALKAWLAEKCNAYLEIDQIVGHLEKRVSRDKQWQDPQFIPYPAKFIRNRLWEDEYETANKPTAPPATWTPTKTAVEQMENQYGSRLVKSVLSEQFTSEHQFRQQCKILAMPA